ncbi:MAG: serine protease [Patescibacteria group bacterium]
MEELNKNQIVLLVLLVSFVTSIATGIVTVTLMDQAPPAVTQTINRIVERTVEKVVPGQPPPIIKEVPVIVTEEELIVKVINGAASGMVRIVDALGDNAFVSSGFFISPDGVIAASGALVGAAASTTSYEAVLRDGRVVPVVKLNRVSPAATTTPEVSPLSELSFFKTLTPLTTLEKWPTLTFAKVAPAVGQTIVALGFADRADINVAVGIVSGFLSTNTSTASSTPLVMTNAASGENQGGPLLNIKGEVIGLSRRAGLAIPSATVIAALAEFK